MTVLWLGLMVGSVHAQITSVSGTVRDEMETLIGATVCEVDATGRNINATITDFNGHFAMKVKSTKNKLKVSFMGYKTQTLPINRTVYNITLESAQRVMKERGACYSGKGSQLCYPNHIHKRIRGVGHYDCR